KLFAAPNVVAAGDVAKWFHSGYGRHLRLEHWTNAQEQGRQAVENLVDPERAKDYRPIPYFWSDLYGRRIQMAGILDPERAYEVDTVSGSLESGRFCQRFRSAGRVTATIALGDARAFNGARRGLELPY